MKVRGKNEDGGAGGYASLGGSKLYHLKEQSRRGKFWRESNETNAGVREQRIVMIVQEKEKNEKREIVHVGPSNKKTGRHMRRHALVR